ncbi:MAG TPA: hypothetical protein VGJ97_03310 [Anaerolineaceae bacterium]|jgi:hypothetical protein
MRTAAQYQHDVDGLDVEGIKTSGLSDEEARQALQKIIEVQEKLHQTENSLNLDLHALERQFQGRANSMNLQNANRGGRARQEEEQRLDEEKQHKLVPYEDVRKKVEELLPKVEQMRSELERTVPGAVAK